MTTPTALPVAAERAPFGALPASVGAPTLILLAALWIVALGNFAFWRAAWEAVGGLRADNLLFVLLLPVAALALTYLVLALLAWGRATKAVLGALLVLSAGIGYFEHTFGTLLDATMVTNVVQSHAAEALEFMTWRLAAWVIAFGAVPALLVARVRVARQPWTRELRAKALTMAAALACLGAVMFLQAQHYTSLLRTHRELRLLLTPYNVLAAVKAHVGQRFGTTAALQPVGPDATRVPAAAASGKPAVTVLVIGETARAANFSLNGYARPTNPGLARENVVSFSDVRSCGTSTAVSVPCMFLDVGRAGYESKLAKRREGLLDVLQRAGVAVYWLDNNSGCKGVCDRVPHESVAARQDAALCRGGECYDGILIKALQERIDSLRGDAVIVLHMIGSHGPAYYKRYPSGFEAFTPACDTAQIDRCPREAIVNAYDNSIRYTDHVLSQAIELLRLNAHRVDATLLYTSDHGESLGENGMYLHGLPYALAPREQVQVPLVLWLSDGAQRRLNIDAACLEARRNEPLSHDYLFHSMLALSSVRTSAYQPERDLLSQCRL